MLPSTSKVAFNCPSMPWRSEVRLLKVSRLKSWILRLDFNDTGMDHGWSWWKLKPTRPLMRPPCEFSHSKDDSWICVPKNCPSNWTLFKQIVSILTCSMLHLALAIGPSKGPSRLSSMSRDSQSMISGKSINGTKDFTRPGWILRKRMLPLAIKPSDRLPPTETNLSPMVRSRESASTPSWDNLTDAGLRSLKSLSRKQPSRSLIWSSISSSLRATRTSLKIRKSGARERRMWSIQSPPFLMKTSPWRSIG